MARPPAAPRARHSWVRARSRASTRPARRSWRSAHRRGRGAGGRRLGARRRAASSPAPTWRSCAGALRRRRGDPPGAGRTARPAAPGGAPRPRPSPPSTASASRPGLELALACSYRLASDSSRDAPGPAAGTPRAHPRARGHRPPPTPRRHPGVARADPHRRVGRGRRRRSASGSWTSILPARRTSPRGWSGSRPRARRARAHPHRRPPPRSPGGCWRTPRRDGDSSSAAREADPARSGARAPPPRGARCGWSPRGWPPAGARIPARGRGRGGAARVGRGARPAARLGRRCAPRGRAAATGLPRRPSRARGCSARERSGSELAFLLAGADVPVLLKDRRRDALPRGGRHVLDLLRARGAGGGREPRGADAAGAAPRGERLRVRRLRHPRLGGRRGGAGPEEPPRRRCARPRSTRAATASWRSPRSPPLPAGCSRGWSTRSGAVGLRFSRPVDLFPLLEIVAGAATGRRGRGRLPRPRPPPGSGAAGRRRTAPTRPGTACSARSSRRRCASSTRAPARARSMAPRRASASRSAPSGGWTPWASSAAFALLEPLAASCGERFGPTAVAERLAGDPPLFYRYRNGLPRRPRGRASRRPPGGRRRSTRS